MNGWCDNSKLFLHQETEEATRRLGRQLIRVLMLGSFLPIARIMFATG
jgi:hypothetical protein